jgi:hypothetical protein
MLQASNAFKSFLLYSKLQASVAMLTYPNDGRWRNQMGLRFVSIVSNQQYSRILDYCNLLPVQQCSPILLLIVE